MSTISLSHLGLAPCRHGLMVWPRSDATIGRSLERYKTNPDGVMSGHWTKLLLVAEPLLRGHVRT
jgi:hypothetical protein